MKTNAESILWSAFLKGNKDAFGTIYNRYSNFLLSYARCYTDETALVEDCIQELFIELWEKRSNLSETDSVQFYLQCCIKRKLYRRLQQQTKYIAANDICTISAAPVTASYESVFILNEKLKERQVVLNKAINSLPVRQRKVMYMRYYEGLSFDQIAGLMLLNRKTAYNIVFKALDSLRKNRALASC